MVTAPVPRLCGSQQHSLVWRGRLVWVSPEEVLNHKPPGPATPALPQIQMNLKQRWKLTTLLGKIKTQCGIPLHERRPTTEIYNTERFPTVATYAMSKQADTALVSGLVTCTLIDMGIVTKEDTSLGK